MIELALVIPTFNERDNIEELLGRLTTVLSGIAWEAIFVDDDSTDGTAALIRSLNGRYPHVRALQRIGRRGLSSACIEGMLATSAPYMAVMDADLQHDESILPVMLNTIKAEELDLVVGSRHVGTGSVGDFAAHRQALSRLGKNVGRRIYKCDIQDPMSGFFMVRRTFFEKTAHRLSGISFKILVDLLASAPEPVRFREIPYRFRSRIHGESKLDTTNLIEYLFLLADKTVGAWVPVRFIMFSISGLSGVVIFLALFWALYARWQVTFELAEGASTAVAICTNFLVNNWVTYRDRRLKGARLIRGFLWFCLACSIGAWGSFSIASFGFQKGLPWQVAGLTGLIITSVWNYGVTAAFTWRAVGRR
ncbi:MAG TPA: glycosyltransferase family 2 protein [Terriglobia bacterium]|nr:glycosyltransferase family 2 protein [Terriglobia bacterium]